MRTMNNSNSSINTINHCRRKYYYKYIAKNPEKKNIDALVGIIVHKAIKERIKNQKLKCKNQKCGVAFGDGKFNNAWGKVRSPNARYGVRSLDPLYRLPSTC